MATKLGVGAWPGCLGRYHCCAPPANESSTSGEPSAPQVNPQHPRWPSVAQMKPLALCVRIKCCFTFASN